MTPRRPALRAALLPPWLDRNVGIVLLSRYAMSASRAIAGVVTALYLTAEGFPATELGLLFLCVTVTSLTMSASIGLLSDRVGRKPFLVVVPLLSAAAAAVYSSSRSAAVLFIFAGLGSFGRGAGAGGGTVGPYQPAEAAFVAERVPSGARASAFGRMYFLSALGALVGGLLAGLARPGAHASGAAATAAYRPAFLAAAALAAAAGLLALGIDESHQRTVRRGKARRPSWPRRSWPALWRLWLTNGVNGIGIGMLGPFVSYWFFRRYGASPPLIGAVFAAVNLASLVSTLMAARVAKRLGTVRAIAAARAAGGILLFPMVLAPAFWTAAAVYVARMSLQRLGLPLRQAFTQDLADPEERASLAALSVVPAQGTMAGSQVAAGYLFEQVSLGLPFELAGAFQLLNGLLYAVVFGRRGGVPAALEGEGG